MGSSPPPGPPQGVPSLLEKDHVNLRMSYLVMGNPRPPHSLGNVHLNTTIQELKEKIQSELPEHPALGEQRLIYQGRPLLRNDATLRDVLRLEPGHDPGPLPHTIHIVIQSPQTAPPPQPPTNRTTNAPTPAPVALPMPNQLQQQHQPQQIDLNGPFRAAETSANRLQESLARIQQQIETNRADLRSVQQRIALQHTHLAQPPSAGQTNANGQIQPVHVFQQPALAVNLQFGMPYGHQHVQQAMVHPRQQPMQALNAIPATNPGATVNSAGLQPQRMTMVTETRNIQIPMPRPSSAPGQRQSESSQQQANVPSIAPQASNPGAPSLVPSINFPPPMAVPPMPFPGLFSQPRPHLAYPINTTAWVLSAPTGPQAFLFSPGHGFFSSSTPAVVNQQQGRDMHDPHGMQAANDPLHDPVLGQAIGQNPQDAERAIVRVEQAQPAAGLAQAQENAQENDLFGFIINRGWLFLRLYLFMFVFSEPGTWKRWLMIVVAAIVCLQPRDGPATRLMQAARQHFDALVGPPAPAPQPDHQRGNLPDQPNAMNPPGELPARRPANVRGAVQMTPQEAAARIVAGHQNQHQRQPRFWRDTFYRVEQSVALFLASLIPGVGERHVRAREEARRDEQRREEERQRLEAEATVASSSSAVADRVQVDDAEYNESTAAPKSEVIGGDRGEQSTSTSVQANDADETAQLRNRA